MSSKIELYITNCLTYIMLDFRTQMSTIIAMCYAIKESTNEVKNGQRFAVITNYSEHIFNGISDLLAAYKQGAIGLKKSPLETLDKLSLDFLTGIHNPQAFRLFIQQKLNCLGTDEQCYLFLIDIDRLRDINEKYNLIVGDRLLQQFVEIIENYLKESDYFARVGGKQFAIISSKESSEAASELAQKIQETIANHVFLIQSYSISITIKIGWISFSAEDQSVDKIIRRADFIWDQNKQLTRED